MFNLNPNLMTLWACVLSAVYKPALQDVKSDGFSALLSHGFGANYIVWFALLVGSRIILSQEIKRNSTRDYIVLCAALLLICIPSANLAWLAASFVALSLINKCPSPFASLLIFTACIREPITSVALKIFAGNILGMDAHLTNIALKLMGLKALLQSNILITENGHPLLILTGCSVFTNLSYVSLLWLSIYASKNLRLSTLSFLSLTILILLTLGSNAMRLALMTTSEQAYLYYHDGTGSQIFEWGLMALSLLLIIVSSHYETIRKNIPSGFIA